MTTTCTSIVSLALLALALATSINPVESFGLRVNTTNILDGAGAILGNMKDDEEENRIIGGQAASQGEFPFYCDIRVGTGKGHWCGGTLLPSGRHVLTAAHCLVGYENNILTGQVWCNAYQVKSQGNAVARSVASLHIYNKEEKNRGFDVDAAIITLSGSPITSINKFLTCNQDANWPNQDNFQMVTIGMGTIEQPDKYVLPGVLQKLTMYHDPKCSPYGGINKNAVICADDNDNNNVKNGCRGDSGSPIFSGGKHIGIDSFGSGKCEYPTGFARTSAICPWACSYDSAFCGSGPAPVPEPAPAPTPAQGTGGGGVRADPVPNCQDVAGTFIYFENGKTKEKTATCEKIKQSVLKDLAKAPNTTPPKTCAKSNMLKSKCPTVCDGVCASIWRSGSQTDPEPADAEPAPEPTPEPAVEATSNCGCGNGQEIIYHENGKPDKEKKATSEEIKTKVEKDLDKNPDELPPKTCKKSDELVDKCPQYCKRSCGFF